MGFSVLLASVLRGNKDAGGLSGSGCSVDAPGEVIAQVDTKVPDAGDLFYCRPSNVHINAEAVIPAPTLHTFHLLPAARLVVGDASTTAVPCKLYNMSLFVYSKVMRCILPESLH